MQALVDSVYEAAFVPELWPNVLDRVAEASRSASGSVLVFSGFAPPRYRATALTDPGLHAFTTTDAWRRGRRRLDAISPAVGFHCDVEYLTPAELAEDAVASGLRDIGLGWQQGTTIAMPTAEVVVFTFERRLADGRHEPESVKVLDAVRPHLARAGLMAARLGLERSRTAVAALEIVGLPAAVLSAEGRVLASNPLFDSLRPPLVARAGGFVGLVHAAANRLLQSALSETAPAAAVRSVPVPADAGRRPLIIHLVPLRGQASDVFSGASTLMIVTELARAAAPGLEVLSGLFDLTPAEARVTAALQQGRTLEAVSEASGVTVSTLRTHLQAIFQKTGTTRQAELVALVSGAGRLAPPP